MKRTKILPKYALHQEWYNDDQAMCNDLGLKLSDIYEDEDYMDEE